MVFLRQQDSGRIGEVPRCVRRASGPRLRSVRTAVRAERRGFRGHSLGVHSPRRRQVGHLDRRPQKPVHDSERSSVHSLHGTPDRSRRCRPRRPGDLPPYLAHILLRRPALGPVFLEAVRGRNLHGHRHERPRSGHDAAQPRLPRQPLIAQEHDRQRRNAVLRHCPVPDSRNRHDALRRSHSRP